jgi:hypothetical protein
MPKRRAGSSPVPGTNPLSLAARGTSINPAECQDCVRLPVYHSRAGGSHGCSADWAGGWAKRVAVPVIRYDDCIYVRPFKEAAFDYAFILTQMGIAN